MKKLLIDMDGVCCDFVAAACREFNIRTGGNLKSADIVDWDLSLFGITKNDWQKSGFFAELRPIDGAIETLKMLSCKYRLAIVTDAMGIDFIISDKEIWIKKHLPFIDEVFYVSDKSSIDGDLLFDDAPHHLSSYPQTTVKMLTRYNAETVADYTVKSWAEFESLLHEGEGII